jgi:hypothetical protein
MAKGLFTALFNALSDPKSYYAMQKEMNLKAVAETFFNTLAGKTTFDAVVLPENIGDKIVFDGQRAVRVRPLGIYDFIIPEPCDFDDPSTRKRILSLHPIAYPDSIEGGTVRGADPLVFETARVVECFFKDGPQSSGRLRGLTYRPKANKGLSGPNPNYSCLFGDTMPEGASGVFDGGGYSEFVGPPSPTTSGVLSELTSTEKEYVNKSTDIDALRNTENYKIVKKHYGRDVTPKKLTYLGSMSEFYGKQFLNGTLPLDMIAQSNSAAGYPALFIKDIVQDFDNLAKAFQSHFNMKLIISGKTIDRKNIPSGTYRTFDQQVRIKADKISEKKSGEASEPGRSNHGWGMAFDFNTHYGTKSGFESETYKWMLKNAPKFGFENPYTFRDGKGWDEAWHIQWVKIKEIWR